MPTPPLSTLNLVYDISSASRTVLCHLDKDKVKTVREEFSSLRGVVAGLLGIDAEKVTLADVQRAAMIAPDAAKALAEKA